MTFIFGYSVHFSLHLVINGFDFLAPCKHFWPGLPVFLYPISKLKLFWRELKCFLCSWELSSCQVWGLYTALLCYSNLTVLALNGKLEYFPPFCFASIPTQLRQTKQWLGTDLHHIVKKTSFFLFYLWLHGWREWRCLVSVFPSLPPFLQPSSDQPLPNTSCNKELLVKLVFVECLCVNMS